MPTAPVRVCLIAPEFIGPFPNGGVGTACYWEAMTLARAGYDVTVLYTGPTERESPDHWEAAYGKGPFGYVDLARWTGRTGVQTDAMRHPCGEAHVSELVLEYLRRTPFDLLLFQEFLGHGCRALQARRSGESLAGARTGVTLHSSRQWIYRGMRRLPNMREDLYVDFLERESARLADGVAAPSQHMADWAAEHWKLEGTAVVPYCYDPTLEQTADIVEHEGPFTHLVFFGRLETRKGLHLFCRALADHASARGPVQKVTFLGKPSRVEGRPSEEFIRTSLATVADVDVQILDSLGSLEALQWLACQRNTLVVAPSLVDNLPYALIELVARRVPFVSTRVGGIPEIVGSANQHLLCDASSHGVAGLLADVHGEGRLTIDYRSAYSITRSNAAHLAWVESLLALPSRARVDTPSGCIVIVDATEDALPLARLQYAAADAVAGNWTFMTWRQWRASGDDRPAIFASKRVRPRQGLVARLCAALGDSDVVAATSYYATETADGSGVVTPLGASLEAGWAENVFGGLCFAARAGALTLLRETCPAEFQFWPAYAAIAADTGQLAVVPECLYEGPSPDDSIDAVEAVSAAYRRHGSSRLDIEWMIKHAAAAQNSAVSHLTAGRALYERLVHTPDVQVQALAQWSASDDLYVREMRQLRGRLSTLAAEWSTTCPRVFVYGAGQHTRLLFLLEPDLARHVVGFIDRRAMHEFLGKPCIRPEEITPAIADAVLYSSREFEREMYMRLAGVNVRHVLLYADTQASPPETTSSRLRRRFGHRDAPVDALREMYHPPDWVQGGCSGGDVEFLLEMVAAVNPTLVVELGVASGTSSAALLLAMDRLGASATERLLVSGDVRPTCYFDPARATGGAVHEMYPRHRTKWLLDTDTDARRLSKVLPPGTADFCFIDANHAHPWPLLDLLHLSTVARPASWIALHDIELPRLYPQFQVHGAQWLFEAWPFNKIHGVDGSVNIGAVQLPRNLEQLVPMAIELLQRPWEHRPTTWDVHLPEVFTAVSNAIRPRLARPAAALAG